MQTGNRGNIYVQDCSNQLLQKSLLRDCISMCFDICTINIRVSIRVRGLHLVIRTNRSITTPGFGAHLTLERNYGQCQNYRTEVKEYEGTVIYRTLLFHNSVFLGRYEKKTYLNLPLFFFVVL